jgi:hypothetical protein
METIRTMRIQSLQFFFYSIYCKRGTADLSIAIATACVDGQVDYPQTGRALPTGFGNCGFVSYQRQT